MADRTNNEERRLANSSPTRQLTSRQLTAPVDVDVDLVVDFDGDRDVARATRNPLTTFAPSKSGRPRPGRRPPQCPRPRQPAATKHADRERMPLHFLRSTCEMLLTGRLRCSTDHQDLSPDAQQEAITRWAMANGVEVVSWHFDKGISGSAEIGDRPELLAALADLRGHGAGVLVVAKRDRLARDTLVAHLVERAAVEQGARVVSADGVANGDDPASIMLRKILDVVAEYERRIIRARIVAALAVKKQRRERTGSVPYGFVLAPDARSLVPEPHEQKVIELARSYRGTGMTFRAVAWILEGRGFTSRTGKRFHATQIQRMVA